MRRVAFRRVLCASMAAPSKENAPLEHKRRKVADMDNSIQMLWRGKQIRDKVTPIMLVRSFIAKDEDQCSIWHEAIKDVELDGLPKCWKLSHNAVRLPCNHIFHASAIALHFLTNNMSCPICRDGNPTHKMDVKCLPRDQQDVFTKYVNEYNDRNPVDGPSGAPLWIDISQVMSTFRVEILNPPTEVASTIQGFAQATANNEDSMQIIQLSHCFQRRLNAMSFSLHDRSNPSFLVTNAFLAASPIVIGNFEPLFDVQLMIQRMQEQQKLGHETLDVERPLFIENIRVGRVKFMLATRIHDGTLGIRNFELYLNREILVQAVLTRFEHMISANQIPIPIAMVQPAT